MKISRRDFLVAGGTTLLGGLAAFTVPGWRRTARAAGAPEDAKERVAHEMKGGWRFIVDTRKCIGCGYCIQACPFGARFFDPRLHVVDKCTWCYHRVSQGREPACVYACPVGARNFGDITDPEDPVTKLLGQYTVATRKQELGVEARVYYIGLDNGVR